MALAMNAARVLGSIAQRPPARAGIRGVPLPDDVRRTAEQILGADLSDVRIYVGPEAARMGALAFTMGTRIYFAPGQYDPTTKTGIWLLGHELTHVVQQRRGRVKNQFGYGVAVVKDEALEDEADRFGVQIASAATRDHEAGSAKPTRRREITAAQRAHIFVGAAVMGPKQRPTGVTGYHSTALGGASVAEGYGPKTPLKYGCYWQAVRLRGDRSVVKQDGSTFFPDAWGERDILEAIETASEIRGKPYLEVTTGPGRGMLIFENGMGYLPWFPPA